jgi:hypothetical protein
VTFDFVIVWTAEAKFALVAEADFRALHSLAAFLAAVEEPWPWASATPGTARAAAAMTVESFLM